VIELFVLEAWLFTILYVEAGLLVGVLLKQKFQPPKFNDGEIHYGTIGQFVVGLGVSFGFQAYGADYAIVWTSTAIVSSVWNLLPKIEAYVEAKTRETHTLKVEVQELKKIVEAALGQEIDLTQEELDGKDREALRELLSEKIERVKNDNDIHLPLEIVPVLSPLIGENTAEPVPA